MQIAYPGVFLAMIVEALVRDREIGRSFVAGAVIFGAAKGLKYWAIATLGPLDIQSPGDAGRTVGRGGPYGWLRHPNYLGVAGELAGAALMAFAPLTGVIALVCSAR